MEQTLGKRISSHRKRLSMTQDQLAEKLGVTAQAVSKWENDLSCPDISTLPKLAAIFGITTDALFGTDPESTVHAAEVVEESFHENPGIYFQKGDWKFQMDAGKKSALGFALTVLITGIQLLAAKALHVELSFWAALWPTALIALGITGLWSKFSFFSLGCILFGGYFALDNWDLLPFTVGKGMVFPLILVLFGLSLLVDALKKPNKPTFNMNHSGIPKNDLRYQKEGFDYSASFGEKTQQISLTKFSKGRINTSFGDFTVDLSGVEQVSEHCSLEVSCSFGELELLVPSRFEVKHNGSSAFGDSSVSGQPDLNPQGTIYIKSSVSFGEISIEYI